MPRLRDLLEAWRHPLSCCRSPWRRVPDHPAGSGTIRRHDSW